MLGRIEESKRRRNRRFSDAAFSDDERKPWHSLSISHGRGTRASRQATGASWKGRKMEKQVPCFSGVLGAADPHVAAVFVDDAIRNPKPEPGSLFLLGGEEGLKDRAQFRARNAGAAVEDRETHPLLTGAPVAALVDMQIELTVVPDRFHRIQDEVRDDLAHLAGIAMNLQRWNRSGVPP